ncbi:molybdopterin dinucleotide-binding protein [Brachybacterium sp. UMB0905]|nr:molybdopterin dinucleotide-binding protein [Brachybacterium sp. UMB0905]
MFHEGFGGRYTQPTAHGTGDEDDAYGADDVIYSMCMQCNTFCTIKVRLTEPGDSGATSLVRKIAGNPYSPLTTQPLPSIPYDTRPEEAVQGLGNMPRDAKSRSGGIACLKGQAGPQIVHDNRRLTQPLKRVGERGSGKWVTVTWEEAIQGILEGDEELGTPGIQQWWAYAPQDEVMADWEKVKAGDISQEDFTATWGEKLIDPEIPELGPKSNLMALMTGDKQYLLGERFFNQTFGSINQFNHGGTCGVTGVQGNIHTHPTTRYKRMYADIDYCDYLVVWGTEPLTAQKGPTWLAPRISVARRRGMKMAVIDPRMSKTAEKADAWLPVRPGHDADLAWAMIRWILENERFDEQYLRAPGAAAAAKIGEPTWSDATHLVDVTDEKRPKLSAIDEGLMDAPEEPEEPAGPPRLEPFAVVWADGQLRSAEDYAELADLEVDIEHEGRRLKSVFTLLKERAMERELESYAEASGIALNQIEEVARNLSAAGKRGVVMSYRGPAMHTNGFDAVRAIGYLNFLLGNHDWKGGHIGAQSGFSPRSGRYDLDTVEGGYQPWGIPITREKQVYEKSPFFERDGYPAKRRWTPFGGNQLQEVIPSAAAGYPYSLKALFVNRHAPLNSSPGAHRQAKHLQNQKAIELLVVFDLTMSDTATYADYVLPDLSYLEKFTQESVYPSQQYRVQQLGQPATRAFDGPRVPEETLLELGRALDLPGVGEGAFGKGTSFEAPVDYWLKMAANVAYAGEEPVPDADGAEQEVFLRARQKALGDTFDVNRWKQAVTEEEWPKVVTVLNRGGRFSGQAEERADGYEGDWLKNRYGGLCQFYSNQTAAQKDCMTGEHWDGLAAIRPVMKSDGTVLEQTPERPLQFVNWKSRTQGTYRTNNSAWLREVKASNYLWMAASDAAERGIENGDMVRVTSASGEVEGMVQVLQGIRPGVVGADSAQGHKGYGASAYEVDGTVIDPVEGYGHADSARRIIPGQEEVGIAPHRGTGFSVNALLDEDTVEGGGGMMDPIGGGAAQLDTWVQVTKI